MRKQIKTNKYFKNLVKLLTCSSRVKIKHPNETYIEILVRYDCNRGKQFRGYQSINIKIYLGLGGLVL